jgi:hypothetical protein
MRTPSVVLEPDAILPAAESPFVGRAKKGRPGRPPRDPADWAPTFLENYEQTGNAYASAKAAGVDVKTVRKHRRMDAHFERQVKTARRAFVASLQEELVKQARKGNTIATLARLKASGRRMAERYSEKAVDARVLNLQVNQYGAPATLANARDFLAQCLADATPATRAALAPAPERDPRHAP